jgi:hypothetical protein
MVELARTVPPPPRQLKPSLPRALEAICLKAMAHRPQGRYANARELAEEVRRYLAGVPVLAYPQPLATRVWRWCRRHRQALARSAAAVVMLGLCSFGAFYMVTMRREQEALRQKEEERNRCDSVRERVHEFDRLADERQFYTALTTPAGDKQLYQDGHRGEGAGRKALALADDLLADLSELPLPDERAAFQVKLHDLLLLTAQSRLLGIAKPDAAEEVRKNLERAGPGSAAIGPPAGCFDASSEKSLAVC